MEKEIISVEYNNHKIFADIFPAGSIPQVFCLHGAGQASRKLYTSLRQILMEKNIPSCALDFLGHGETGGDINQSSLKARTEQAKAIIESTKPKMPITIFGSSMGGYNAIKLTEIFEVKLLVLLAPGIYDKDAYEVPFGENFSSIIRKDRSWDNTDAWGILNKYKGKIIIVTGSNDEVVPFEIIQKIYDNSTQASFREIITINEAPHRLLTVYFPEHPEELKKLADKLMKFLK